MKIRNFFIIFNLLFKQSLYARSFFKVSLNHDKGIFKYFIFLFMNLKNKPSLYKDQVQEGEVEQFIPRNRKKIRIVQKEENNTEVITNTDLIDQHEALNKQTLKLLITGQEHQNQELLIEKQKNWLWELKHKFQQIKAAEAIIIKDEVRNEQNKQEDQQQEKATKQTDDDIKQIEDQNGLEKVKERGPYILQQNEDRIRLYIDVHLKEIWMLRWQNELGIMKNIETYNQKGVPKWFCKYIKNKWKDIAISTSNVKVITNQSWVLRKCKMQNREEEGFYFNEVQQNLLNGKTATGTKDHQSNTGGYTYFNGQFDTYSTAVDKQENPLRRNMPLSIYIVRQKKSAKYQYCNYEGGKKKKKPVFGKKYKIKNLKIFAITLVTYINIKSFDKIY
ncbi:hypothetical protein pb186bvf_018625 [Paramecium bursaria]